MTDSSRSQCTYEYEVLTTTEPDDRIDVTRPAVTQCPHDIANPDAKRCLFHHGDGNFPSSRFTDEFSDALTDEQRDPNFAGTDLNGLQLSQTDLTTPSGRPIDFRGATIHGDLNLTNATIDVPLLLDNAAITGSIYADGAEFDAPVSLVGVDVRGRLHLHEATVTGGIVANDLDTGYVDARDLTVDGPVILDRASFAANLKLARATIDGELSLEAVHMDHSLDATGLTVTGDYTASETTIESEMDHIAATIGGDVDVRKLHVGEDIDWSHGRVEGDITATDCHFEQEACFEDVSIGGTQLTFDATQFDGEADFATLQVPDGRISFSNATFDGDTWFVYARIDDTADFTGATFSEMVHLRDATFEGDLLLRNATTTGRTVLHQSTIEGDYDSADAEFEHFQFSATVRGKADFSRTRFIEKALFMKSEFDDRVWFDDATFAGHPDFSDTRFTGEPTFDDTEFLVEPTFEGTRFAVDPNLDDARYPTDASIDLAERRKDMVLAHPDSLQHTGTEVPAHKLSGELVIPASGRHLVTDDLTRTKIVTSGLKQLDSQDWYSLFERPLRIARTAAGQLPADDAILVFGLRVNPDENPGPEFFESATVVGVYTNDGTTISFGHLDPDLTDVDYLIPIPASDEAFEAGAAVATRSELRQATIRNQLFRTALLGKYDEDDPPVNSRIAPVLVAVAEIEP